MFSGSEAHSYLRLIDFVYRPTLGLRVIKNKNKVACEWLGVGRKGAGVMGSVECSGVEGRGRASGARM